MFSLLHTRHATTLLFMTAVCVVGCGKDTVSKKDERLKIVPPSLNDENSDSNQNADETLNNVSTAITPHFEMIGAESGFNFKRFDDISRQRRISEVNGGGIAVIDLDNDGTEDLFMTNGCRVPNSLNDKSTPGSAFRNLGSMQFREVSIESGLRQFGFKHGAAVADWDADGFDDLYLTAFGKNEFWRNNGDGTFSEIADMLGVSAPEWGSSAAFGDVNQDGLVDLYVVNYLDESDVDPKLCPNPASPDGFVGCSPAIFDGVTDRLFISSGTLNAIDVTAQCGLNSYQGKGLGVVIVDLNGDLIPEIYVANDGQENHLFRIDVTASETETPNAGSVQLSEFSLSANVALNETGYAQASMGVAADDFDRDGNVDLFLTHFFGDTNTLYANRGGVFFEDITRSSGLGNTSRDKLGFGTSFIDADNNGWLDLAIANGHVDNREWMPGWQPWKMQPQFYLNNTDSTFTDVSRLCGDYFQQRWLGRGLAVADLNNDGRQDFVVSHQIDEAKVLYNQTETPNLSVVVRLVGTASNRTAIGASATVINATPILKRTIIGGGSFQSASSARLHFGLGEVEQIDLEIHWPTGDTEIVTGLTKGQWTVVEGRGVAIQN